MMKVENSKHIERRLLVVVIVLVLFAMHSFLFIDGNQRSCLGNPAAPPYVMIGMPAIIIIAVIDIIYLAVIKKVNTTKIIANTCIALIVFLSIFLFSY